MGRLGRAVLTVGLALALSLIYWVVLLLLITSDDAFKPFRYMGF